MNIIHEAAMTAWCLHSGQTRAGGQPYIYHPMRVAGFVSLFGDDDKGTPLTNDMIAAAWLHDIYEDTDMNSPGLNYINPVVERLVDELTNRFTKEAYPNMNRAERKGAEIPRIAAISPAAQIIKLCDRLDNLETIQEKEKKFHALYCDESDALIDAISVGPFLQIKILDRISQVRKSLEIS